MLESDASSSEDMDFLLKDQIMPTADTIQAGIRVEKRLKKRLKNQTRKKAPRGLVPPPSPVVVDFS